MDIVEYSHPMLSIESFEVFASHNQGMVVLHALGTMIDTQQPAYVTFPVREVKANDWVGEVVNLTKGYPGMTKQLLSKCLGPRTAEKVMAAHSL